MSWAIIAALIIIAACLIGVAYFVEDDNRSNQTAYVGIATGVLAVCVFGAQGFRTWMLHNDEARCDGFADESGLTVEFREWNYWTWDCLVLDEFTGHWVPLDNYRNRIGP